MKKQHLHFMGIGGSGASGAASIASHLGYIVSGCDLILSSEYVKHVPVAVKRQEGHSSKHLDGVDMLVISPAVTALDPKNPEISQAKARRIPVVTWPVFLGSVLAKDKRVIAVCGTHGKSTTTALIGLMLEAVGLSPTVLLGAIVPKWNRNYRIGTSDLFVIEADEYNESFLAYHPHIMVLTTLEYDHPDYFPSFDTMVNAFVTFVCQITPRGQLIIDPDDPGTRKLVVKLRKLQGISLPHITRLKQHVLKQVTQHTRLMGEFNRKNAALALLAVCYLGVSREQSLEALHDFEGVRRRLDLVGEVGGVRVYDDYAHHPTAIKATLTAVNQQFPDRPVLVVFQPHMYSRTKALELRFIDTFRTAPFAQAVIVDIFAAREKEVPGVSSQALVEKVGNPRVQYIGGLHEAADFVSQNATKGTIILVMGAGDSTKVSRRILAKLKRNY